ncbi:MAG: dihydropteroate synthase [Chloroflexota bacterium]
MTGAGVTRIGGREFRWGQRPFVMGIINVTPDSFSGDGLACDVGAAVARAQEMEAAGADILDIGGESTRPGSAPITADEELGRVLPALERIVAAVKVPVSIDTYKVEVARRAVAAGASLINDVWGLKQDPALARVAAEAGVPLVVMHNQRGTCYVDLVAEVLASLRWSLGRAEEAGVPLENLIVDPGIGFGKTLEHNLELMRRLRELRSLGRPVLLGTSRKSMIGLVLGLPPDQRMEGTAATVALGIAGGADIVRVHDVAPMVRVCRMADAIVRGYSTLR